MSLEAAASRIAVPFLGVAGGAGLFLASVAAQGAAGIEKYGAMGLLALLLVWMTQQLSKKLDALLEALHGTREAIQALRAETRETRATLERQDHRLEAVEGAVRSCTEGRG